MERTIAEIDAHIAQVQRSLNDSQEHGQIVRLDRKLKELWAERACAAKHPEGK